MSTEQDARSDAAPAPAVEASTTSQPPSQADPKSAEEKPENPSTANGTTESGSASATADSSKDVQSSEAAQKGTSSDAAQGGGENSAVATADSTKNSIKAPNGKRRSSAGVPEHKNKKTGGKKGKAPPTLQLNVKPGEFYWARLKGHPPWPAVICDEEMLPEKIIEHRPVTAQRPDGSYREDYLEGGKNVKDRTYAIMYLGTYEFSWMPNIDLSPINMEDVKEATQGKKTKMLWAAYEQLKEQPDLQHFKDILSEHERALAEAEAQYEASLREKEEKKANKNKRKSKGAVTDDDTEMADAAEDGSKPSKKRKKNADSDGDNEKAAKTPKTKLKVSLKTPNGDSASKAKPKPSSSKKSKKSAEPELTPEEIFDIRKKQILYIRHKLQKGFLSRDTPPKEEEMETMANHLSDLEKETQLEAPVIRATRINKVLKGMLKLASIPRDSEFRFKERSTKLLESWNKILAEDKTSEEEADKKQNGAAANADGETKGTSAPKTEKSSATPSQADGLKEKESSTAKKNDEDVTMADATPVKSEEAKQGEPKKEDDKDEVSKETGAESKADVDVVPDAAAKGAATAEVTA